MRPPAPPATATPTPPCPGPASPLASPVKNPTTPLTLLAGRRHDGHGPRRGAASGAGRLGSDSRVRPARGGERGTLVGDGAGQAGGQGQRHSKTGTCGVRESGREKTTQKWGEELRAPHKPRLFAPPTLPQASTSVHETATTTEGQPPIPLLHISSPLTAAGVRLRQDPPLRHGPPGAALDVRPQPHGHCLGVVRVRARQQRR